jgi:TRAP transporter TAXI family solute receptor
MAKESTPGKKGGRKGYLAIFGLGFLLTVAGFLVAYQFVEPAPPRKIIIGTGDKSGAYYAFAQQYKKILARDGITLEVRSTAGSGENLKLLSDPESGVDIALVQGGMGDPASQTGLQSLASLYFEPLWVFFHRDLKVKRLPDLRGRKIAIGPEASGTNSIAVRLLGANGITPETATFHAIGGEKARDALIAGEVEAAFFVLSPQSAVVQNLLLHEKIRVLGFERGEAYQRANRFLSILKLPEGIMDFARNIPRRDIFLLAPAATLVVRDSFHPALVDLFLDAAAEVHGGPGLFQDFNEFPSQKYLDFPLHKDAQRYFKSGPPFLKRYLPFWAAVFVERAKVLLLPLITLLIPLIRSLPPGFRWRIRSRIYRWYRDLSGVDSRGAESQSPEEIRVCLAELDRIEKEVLHVSVPQSYAGELYSLRMHISFVGESLRKREAAFSGGKEQA